MAKQKSHEEIQEMPMEDVKKTMNKVGNQLKKIMEDSVKKSEKVLKNEGLSKVLEVKFVKDEEKGFSFQIVPRQK